MVFVPTVRAWEGEEGTGGGGAWRNDFFEKRRTTPLRDETALFRKFAFLPPKDRVTILAFANAYGQLGVGEYAFPDPLLPPSFAGLPDKGAEQITQYARGECNIDSLSQNAQKLATRYMHPGAESLANWTEAILDMRLAVHLWDSVHARDYAALSAIITEPKPHDEFTGGSFLPWVLKGPFAGETWRIAESWSGNRDVAWRCPVSFGSAIGDAGHLSFAPEALRNRGDVLQVAQALVVQAVNVNLFRRVQPDLTVKLGTGTPALRFYPDDLLRAMWLQFAQGIAGNKDYRACSFCNSWFDLSSSYDGRTARRMFCSDACKSRDYRKRLTQKPTKKKRK
jgi:hypothetical protein